MQERKSNLVVTHSVTTKEQGNRQQEQGKRNKPGEWYMKSYSRIKSIKCTAHNLLFSFDRDEGMYFMKVNLFLFVGYKLWCVLEIIVLAVD